MFWRKKLQIEIRNQRDEIGTLKAEQQEGKAAINETQNLHRHNAELTTEINKLKEQVREQTEADLFFVSAKICFELSSGKSKKEIKTLIERQQLLQGRLAAIQQQQSPMTYYGQQGLFGGLCGGIFG